jgi:hypothetical protein
LQDLFDKDMIYSGEFPTISYNLNKLTFEEIDNYKSADIIIGLNDISTIDEFSNSEVIGNLLHNKNLHTYSASRNRDINYYPGRAHNRRILVNRCKGLYYNIDNTTVPLDQLTKDSNFGVPGDTDNGKKISIPLVKHANVTDNIPDASINQIILRMSNGCSNPKSINDPISPILPFGTRSNKCYHQSVISVERESITSVTCKMGNKEVFIDTMDGLDSYKDNVVFTYKLFCKSGKDDETNTSIFGNTYSNKLPHKNILHDLCQIFTTNEDYCHDLLSKDVTGLNLI